MENQNYNFQADSVFVQEERTVSKKFFANVFLWMFIALSLSTITAYIFGTDMRLMQFLVSVNPTTGKSSSTIIGMVVMFSPLALVFAMGRGISRLSYSTLVTLFVLYAILTGASLSFILLSYTATSIFSCFAAAAGIFGIMAVMGYTTNVDLSKFGPILMVGVIGLVIASLVNMFIQSAQFDLFLAFIGIAIFTALTAYDVQKIKRIGQGIEATEDGTLSVDARKSAIVAALSLYLDFLNIFLFLLRIFGNRK